MRKKVIEERYFSEFSEVHEFLQRIHLAGFHADFRCLTPEPKGYGISIGDYYEVTIFQWTEDDE